jgi:hypothetical protein
MDIFDRVSDPGVLTGPCILSDSLLSVRRKHVLPNQSLQLNEAQIVFLATNVIRTQTSVLHLTIHLVAHDSTPSLHSLSTPILNVT